MKSFKYIGVAVAMLCISSCASTEIEDSPESIVGPLASWMFPVDNLLLINFSTLLLQAAHTLAVLSSGGADTLELPEFKFQFTEEQCLLFLCQTYQDDISLGHVKIPLSYDLFDADVQINDQTISYSTSIPSVRVNSDDFNWSHVNLNTSTKVELSQLEVTISNVSFSFNGNIKEDLRQSGPLAVGNIDINMNLGELRLKVPQIVRTNAAGEETVLPGINVNLAPAFNLIWKLTEAKYEEFVASHLNCFLGQTGEGCAADDSRFQMEKSKPVAAQLLRVFQNTLFVFHQ